jgi:hypothetical protein
MEKHGKTSSNPSLVGISTGISFTEGKLDNDCPPKQFNAQKWLTFYLWQRCPIRNCESEQQCWGCLSCLIQWWQWLLKIWTNWVYFKHMFKQYMYIYIYPRFQMLQTSVFWYNVECRCINETKVLGYTSLNGNHHWGLSLYKDGKKSRRPTTPIVYPQNHPQTILIQCGAP